jgi:hypothetical protein
MGYGLLNPDPASTLPPPERRRCVDSPSIVLRGASDRLVLTIRAVGIGPAGNHQLCTGIGKARRDD